MRRSSRRALLGDASVFPFKGYQAPGDPRKPALPVNAPLTRAAALKTIVARAGAQVGVQKSRKKERMERRERQGGS